MRFLPLLIAIVAAPAGAAAGSFCERMPIDPELPAGLSGAYEVVGKDSLTGSAYTATLVLGYGENAYRITHTAQGNTVHGEAWIEDCGPDRIKRLVAQYDTEPRTELNCALGVDGGNYYRATCKTRQGSREKLGLEAWFQQP